MPTFRFTRNADGEKQNCTFVPKISGVAYLSSSLFLLFASMLLVLFM
jgi:hypothetical protein